MITRWHKFRTFLTLLFLTVAFAYLLWQLYQIQLVKGVDFREKADRQHQVNFSLAPQRGTICDRNGKELALNVTVDSVYAHPPKLESVDQAVKALVPLLGISPEVIRSELESRKSFIWLARMAKVGLGTKVKQLKLPGLNYMEEVKRFYPKEELAANVLGFTNIDGKGLEGLELYYDRYLKGTPGWGRSEKDARGREIVLFRDEYKASVNGLSLVLNIDEVIQHIAERELDKAFKKWNAKGAVLVMMEPHTGKILALANRPTFTPNSFQDSDASQRRNRVVTDGFEPGSTFKIVAAAAALEEETFKIDDKIFCENGAYQLYGHTIRDVHPQGWLTFKEVIEESSNIGLVKIGSALGKDKLYSYICAFGFGSKTGIDFPGEMRGLLRPPSRWSKLSLGAIPFGQEVAVTAIQLVSAFSAVANKGVFMKPAIVNSILNEKGEPVIKFEPCAVRRVVSEDTADKLTKILTGVVEKGTGRNAKVKGYSVAGKTGTAQKAERGRYSKDKFVGSFVGYLPAEKPRIVMLVAIDEPRGSHYGGTVAAPVFRKVAEEVMSYLEVTGQ